MLLLIEEHQIDIIGLTESWSHEGILDGEVSFDGFNLFRRDRSDGRRGGGVMLFVKDNIPRLIFLIKLLEIMSQFGLKFGLITMLGCA